MIHVQGTQFQRTAPAYLYKAIKLIALCHKIVNSISEISLEIAAPATRARRETAR